jgi:hypothetical protein
MKSYSKRKKKTMTRNYLKRNEMNYSMTTTTNYLKMNYWKNLTTKKTNC